MTEIYIPSPPCDSCGSTLVETMTVDHSRMLWSCINCGHIWGTPKLPERIPTSGNDDGGIVDHAENDANTFDDHMQRLRADLEGTAARLDRLTSQLERIPACVFIADDEGRYVAANDRACALTGYPRAELLRTSVAGLTAPNEVARHERLWDSFIGTTKQHGVYNIVRKDGNLVKVRYFAYTDLAPGIHISFIVEAV